MKKVELEQLIERIVRKKLKEDHDINVKGFIEDYVDTTREKYDLFINKLATITRMDSKLFDSMSDKAAEYLEKFFDEINKLS
jgi:hypothetical protein